MTSEGGVGLGIWVAEEGGEEGVEGEEEEDEDQGLLEEGRLAGHGDQEGRWLRRRDRIGGGRSGSGFS